jgi:TonB family protein
MKRSPLNYFLFVSVAIFLVPAMSHGEDTTAVDAKGVRHHSNEYSTEQNIPWLVDRLKCPAPKYPLWAFLNHNTGSGFFKIDLDLKTGAVTNVTMLKSTDFDGLDKSAINALKQWTWKPGKWKEIELGVTFTFAHGGSQQGVKAYMITNGSRISEAVTPRPEPVKDTEGHYLTGTGLMRLYLNKSGRVKSIEIVKSTGHPELDASAMRAFNQWKLGKGELPSINVPVQFTDRPSVEIGYRKVSSPTKDSRPKN